MHALGALLQQPWEANTVSFPLRPLWLFQVETITFCGSSVLVILHGPLLFSALLGPAPLPEMLTSVNDITQLPFCLPLGWSMGA